MPRPLLFLLFLTMSFPAPTLDDAKHLLPDDVYEESFSESHSKPKPLATNVIRNLPMKFGSFNPGRFNRTGHFNANNTGTAAYNVTRKLPSKFGNFEPWRFDKNGHGGYIPHSIQPMFTPIEGLNKGTGVFIPSYGRGPYRPKNQSSCMNQSGYWSGTLHSIGANKEQVPARAQMPAKKWTPKAKTKYVAK